ncbi:hypothetical protein [Nocardia sp. NPDC049707]|uniref:hypothetical protein n=1 Tax=Nocardia sp. NPDC049707 TaxID=3154735 RepID=UPI003427D596
MSPVHNPSAVSVKQDTRPISVVISVRRSRAAGRWPAPGLLGTPGRGGQHYSPADITWRITESGILEHFKHLLDLFVRRRRGHLGAHSAIHVISGEVAAPRYRVDHCGDQSFEVCVYIVPLVRHGHWAPRGGV